MQERRFQTKSEWDIIFKFMVGYQGHFKTINKKNFRAKDGTIVMDDKSNIKILKEQSQSLNHKVSINKKVCEHLEQRTMAQELGEPPN